MSPSKLSKLIQAQPGYFLLIESPGKSPNDFDVIKHPIIAWGCDADSTEMLPVTPIGVHDSYDNPPTFLMPDGAIYEPYGEPNWYPNLDDFLKEVRSQVVQTKLGKG